MMICQEPIGPRLAIALFGVCLQDVLCPLDIGEQLCYKGVTVYSGNTRCDCFLFDNRIARSKETVNLQSYICMAVFFIRRR